MNPISENQTLEVMMLANQFENEHVTGVIYTKTESKTQ